MRWFSKVVMAFASVGVLACGQGAGSKPTASGEAGSAPKTAETAVSVDPAKGQLLRVVSSFSVLGDMAREIGGERVQVENLVGIDQDAHVYQPTPQDLQKLKNAQVFVSNGLNYEGWMARMQENSGFKGVSVVASNGVPAIEAPKHGEQGHDHERDHQNAAAPADGHAHGAMDPHAWLDATLVEKYYVPNILKGLIAADPAGEAYYKQRAQAYSAQLNQLSIQIHQILDRIPRAQRKAVVNHRSFEYFGKAYGVDFHSAQGLTTESQPSAKQVAQLIEQIKQDQIRALFVENISNPKLIEQIASETGVRVGGKLYSESLSSETEAYGATYLKMMQYNANQLFAAMR